jgi:hypothetical protein
MCPSCFATLGLIVAGTVSTGGLGALAFNVSRNNNHSAKTTRNPNEKRSGQNVNPHSR